MFVFRIDIDSGYGLQHGIPRILQALEELEVPGSFFCVLGGESGLLEVLATARGTGYRQAAAGVKLPPLEIARVLLFPTNFAERNIALLKEIRRKGHLLGVHGWKHREWSKSLETLNVVDRFALIEDKFKQLFGERPAHFTAPAFRTDLRVLDALDEFGFKTAGELVDGAVPFKPVVNEVQFSHVQVPVTVRHESTAPLIEGMHFAGYSDEQIVRKTTELILQQEKQNGYSCMYHHDLFEGIYKINVLRGVLINVKNAGVEFATVEQAAREFREPLEVSL